MTDLRAQLQSTLGDAYTLERELGGGGMSRVFVAEEKSLGRQVVVKVLPPEMSAGVSIDRFKREIALAARLQHPHIVPLLAAGDAGGLPYFTMPLIEGESLRVRIAKGGELPVSEGLRILREVASALDYAHEKGIVHRDIKPDNILLSRGSAMVSDFGVAKALSESSNAEGGKATSMGIALGTPAYMAPEQAAAAPGVDARADIYAFGVMAYELFAGRPPFHGRSPQATLAAHVTEAPEPITKLRMSLPPALSALIMRCLEKHPADRPQSAADIVHALDAITTPSGGMQPTSAMAATKATGAATGRRASPMVLAGGVIALLLVATGVYWATHRGATGPAPAPEAGVEKSIAVLPFTNVGGDSTTDFFADGMTDELTIALGKIPGLRGPGLRATYAYHERTVDAKEAGAKLHVAMLVEGSVRRNGGRMVVTVQLVKVADGLSLWSDRYDREVKDMAAVQNEIARKIADELKVTLSAGQQTLASAGTQSSEAHLLYLEGMFYEQKYTESTIRKSIALFEQAIAKDSRYAAPWAGMARAWINLSDDWVAPLEGYPKARAAAQHAITLDPNSGDAYAMLGTVLLIYDWDYAAAEREHRRALQLDPRSEWALGGLADLSARQGKFDQALAEQRLVVEAYPLSVVDASSRVEFAIHASRFDTAEVWIARARAIDPAYDQTSLDVALLRMRQGRWAEALDTLAAVRSDFHNQQESQRAMCEAHVGRAAEARRRLESLKAERASRYVDGVGIAAVHVALGDRDEAFRWLDIALKERSAVVRTNDWLWDPIRSDRRFHDLEQRFAAAHPAPK